LQDLFHFGPFVDSARQQRNLLTGKAGLIERQQRIARLREIVKHADDALFAVLESQVVFHRWAFHGMSHALAA
jgi:hypothetical protein